MDMTVDLNLTNGRVVTTEGIFDAGVSIDNGKITAIAKDAHLPKASKKINVKGKPIIPGAIDPHTHCGIYNPFQADVEDASAIASVAGITTIMHCVWDRRAHSIVVPELTAIINKTAYIDMTFYAGIMTPQHIAELDNTVIKLGVTSFKHFLNRPEYEALGALHPDNGELWQSFTRIKNLGGVAMVHCEDYEIARKIGEVLQKRKGRKDAAAWNDSRPDFVEHLKLMEAAFIARITGCPLYVVHTTIGTAQEVVEWCHQNDTTIYIETTPAYLTQTKTDKVGILNKVNPPIRTKGHCEKLWEGVQNGWVDCIGTDHAPMPRKRKVGNGDIWSAMLGYSGVETMLPVMISEGYHKRNLPLQRIVEITSTKTAQIHGIPGKGAIRIGYDADLVVYDLKKTVKVDGDLLHYSAVRDFSLFDGWKLKGWPAMTFSRGSLVAEEGEVIGKKGHGKVVKRLPRTGPKKQNLQYLID